MTKKFLFHKKQIGKKLKKATAAAFLLATICAAGMPFTGENVKASPSSPVIVSKKATAPSSSTMTKAYKNFLKKKVSKKKYYSIVKIGEKNKPVLLIGTGGEDKDKKGSKHFTTCNLYYYKNGKVVKVGDFKDGARYLMLSHKNGQTYLENGGSDYGLFLCIKGGKLYRYEYYNNHKNDHWKQSIIKVDGKIVKTLGYLNAKQYGKYRDSYVYKKDSSIKFIQNKK